jgi:ADP-heptose:LPS heptosyltransferase
MFGAADVPLLTLYGPTDAEKFRPKVSRGRVLRAADFGGAEMTAIPVEAVLGELRALLAEPACAPSAASSCPRQDPARDRLP